MNTISGKAAVFAQADIDTDIIIPANYLNSADPAELAPHAMEPVGGISVGASIVVAGVNFGCGSSREHAVWALTGSGVQAVIADSFARIFFRNAVNNGLLVITLEDAASKFASGDEIEIDQAGSIVRNLIRGTEYSYAAQPEFLQEIVAAGGLLNTLK